MLKHLAKRNGQVVLLSTNTEVVGPYFEVASPHLLRAYRIKHEQDGEIGRSWAVDGYFEEIEK